MAVSEYAHRLVLLATQGWPAAKRKLAHPVAHHHCLNPSCLSPLHLTWGEQGDAAMNEWSFYGRNHKQHFTKRDLEGHLITTQGQGTTHTRRACFRPSADFKAATRESFTKLKERSYEDRQLRRRGGAEGRHRLPSYNLATSATPTQRADFNVSCGQQRL